MSDYISDNYRSHRQTALAKEINIISNLQDDPNRFHRSRIIFLPHCQNEILLPTALKLSSNPFKTYLNPIDFIASFVVDSVKRSSKMKHNVTGDLHAKIIINRDDVFSS